MRRGIGITDVPRRLLVSQFSSSLTLGTIPQYGSRDPYPVMLCPNSSLTQLFGDLQAPSGSSILFKSAKQETELVTTWNLRIFALLRPFRCEGRSISDWMRRYRVDRWAHLAILTGALNSLMGLLSCLKVTWSLNQWRFYHTNCVWCTPSPLLLDYTRNLF